MVTMPGCEGDMLYLGYLVVCDTCFAPGRERGKCSGVSDLYSFKYINIICRRYYRTTMIIIQEYSHQRYLNSRITVIVSYAMSDGVEVSPLNLKIIFLPNETSTHTAGPVLRSLFR